MHSDASARAHPAAELLHGHVAMPAHLVCHYQYHSLGCTSVQVEPWPGTGMPGPFTKAPPGANSSDTAHVVAAFIIGSFGAAAVATRTSFAITLYIVATATNFIIGAPLVGSAFVAVRYMADAALVAIARAVRRRIDIKWEKVG